MTNKENKMEEDIKKVAEAALDEVQQVVDATDKHFEEAVEPIRKGILKRFPVLFMLAVTFGLTATMTGMEQILIQQNILQEKPSIILLIGIGILTLTGTLYKKLG